MLELVPLFIMIAFFMGLVVVVGELVIPLILGRKYPGYSQLRDTISELGSSRSPVSKYLSAWLVILGMLLLVFALGQAVLFASYTWFHLLYLAGIVVFGLGGILAGIFPQDPKGTEETRSGKIHDISSGIGFILLLLTPIWAIWIPEFWNSLILYLFLLLAGWIAFILFGLSKNREGVLGLSGFWQRVTLVIMNSYLLLNYLISMI